MVLSDSYKKPRDAKYMKRGAALAIGARALVGIFKPLVGYVVVVVLALTRGTTL